MSRSDFGNGLGEIGDRLAQHVQPLAVWRLDWFVEFALPAVVNHVDQARIKHWLADAVILGSTRRFTRSS
jgi:hypothetical protein